MRRVPIPHRHVALIAGAIALTITIGGCSGPTATAHGASKPGASGSPGSIQQIVGASPSGGPSSPSASPSAKPPAKPAACSILPSDDVWHAKVTSLPVAAKSATYVKSIGIGSPVHADFGSGLWDGAPIGIPITTVPAGQAKVKVSFQYADESDKGPYAVPKTAKIEGGTSSSGDRHVIVYDASTCTDYELYAAYPQSNGSWKAGSGAIYNLRSDQLRPEGWTSADAAGLPILPGLVTYAEVASGHIDHAIRVTVSATQAAYLWPARHLPRRRTTRRCRRWACGCG